MKTKQLLSPTGEKIGGVHPAVARKLIRSGNAEEKDGQLYLVPKMNSAWGHLKYDRKETRWYPFYGPIWDIREGDPQPAHCVLHFYIDDPFWSHGMDLELTTRKGERMWTRGWTQLAERVEDQSEFRWLSVEEWLRRWDHDEYVHPYPPEKNPELPGNIWVIHPSSEGDKVTQLWVALHYPMPKVEGAVPVDTPETYPCGFLAAICIDLKRRVVLDDWWYV